MNTAAPPCIVLAGGLGTRLRSAVGTLPKCLAPVQGRPFLWWQLQDLASRGVGHFILSLGHGADQVVQAVAPWQAQWEPHIQLQWVVEPAPLGTGGAIRHVMQACQLGAALVANGDSFVGGPLNGLMAPLKPQEGLRLAAVPVPDRSRFGGLRTNEQGQVLAFLERGGVGPGLINAGLYHLNRQALEGVAQSAFSFETAVMPELAANGQAWACEMPGPFIDIGVPEDYARFAARPQAYTAVQESVAP